MAPENVTLPRKDKCWKYKYGVYIKLLGDLMLDFGATWQPHTPTHTHSKKMVAILKYCGSRIVVAVSYRKQIRPQSLILRSQYVFQIAMRSSWKIFRKTTTDARCCSQICISSLEWETYLPHFSIFTSSLIFLWGPVQDAGYYFLIITPWVCSMWMTNYPQKPAYLYYFS